MTSLKMLGWTLPLVAATGAVAAGLAPSTKLQSDAFTVLKGRCVQCHGPNKAQGGLNLSVPQGIVRGGASGPAVKSGIAESSPLWKRVAANQMPPGDPLSEMDKAALKRWIAAGAPGLPAKVAPKPTADEHWSFQPLPNLKSTSSNLPSTIAPIDRLVLAKLRANGLTLSPEADRHTLLRRVAFDLTGLPPTPEEITAFVDDKDPKAYEKMVDRYLASPHYGERWGKYWLDAAGYADSNGYFSADTDRPLAYRYRDYVVRSLNADKPWDRFIQEQLAGDELAGYGPGRDITPEMVELLEATHFLRNSPDGTDSSDGNPDEVKADKYAVLEGEIQIIGASLLGLTTQCGRCHDHKFEPFKQKDYYALQAILYPAFNVANWTTPNRREMTAATAAEKAAFEAKSKEITEQIAARRKEFSDWARANRERGQVVFADNFDGPNQRLAERWSNTLPGDASPAGTPAIQVDSPNAPGAYVDRGRMRLRESGGPGDRILSTRQVIDWTPPAKGNWIQATFDLLDDGASAPYVGYFIALKDFHDTGAATGRPLPGGNILFDGNSQGKAVVQVRYPGPRASGRGAIGVSGYRPGRSYGVRVTNLGGGKFELAQVVDGVTEEGTVTLAESDLPDGAFGFEYCCSRSFTVDNVLIEAGDSMPADPELKALAESRAKRRLELEKAVKDLEAQRPPRPGLLAAVTDLSATPPKVPLLERGEYKLERDAVPAAAPLVLSDPTNPAAPSQKPAEAKYTTGARLAFARWLTKPDSRAAALLARVTVNRWWAHHFGTGIVATTENLGYSGATPTNQPLLDYLAARLIANGWRGKALHREILLSATYRQSSQLESPKSQVQSPKRPGTVAVGSGGLRKVVARGTTSARQKGSARNLGAVLDLGPGTMDLFRAQSIDPDNTLLWRFPLRRLDAEAIRDGMLAISGELDPLMGGPYVPTSRDAEGDVIVADNAAGARKRSLYLQQRRTQVTGLLEVFDAPSIVASCTARPSTTVPLQSLKLLNSAFIRQRSEALARRLEADPDRGARTRQAFLLVYGRGPTPAETTAAARFLSGQLAEYAAGPDAEHRAMTDFCQMLLASNAFLYLE